MDKTQFKFADLDKVPFLDAHKKALVIFLSYYMIPPFCTLIS